MSLYEKEYSYYNLKWVSHISALLEADIVALETGFGYGCPHGTTIGDSVRSSRLVAACFLRSNRNREQASLTASLVPAMPPRLRSVPFCPDLQIIKKKRRRTRPRQSTRLLLC